MKRTIILLLFIVVSASCSLPPNEPVTRDQLMKTRIYSLYIIEESPEQVVNALNREGEVILEGKRNIPGKNFPVHVKLLATSEGIELAEYDR